ncbi:hypothetical protein N665_4685s0002 [Sinapis alba]|nr:hypothetical protein N665_4685s0002 [Sinapis alba]
MPFSAVRGPPSLPPYPNPSPAWVSVGETAMQFGFNSRSPSLVVGVSSDFALLLVASPDYSVTSTKWIPDVASSLLYQRKLGARRLSLS